MTSKSLNVEEARIWTDYEAAMTLAGVIKRFHRNQTFISNLEGIFTHLCRKFEILCNYQRSLHFFATPLSGIDHCKEAHLMLANLDQPVYRTVTPATIQAGKILQRYSKKGCEQLGVPCIVDLSKSEVDELLSAFNHADSGTGSFGILIPFNYGQTKMGTFVLWQQDNPDLETRGSRDEALWRWVSTYYAFLESFLKREYSVFPGGYLPSCYSARWAKAAILFADIRNFTPLTEVLRNAYAHATKQDTTIFREIMNEHCRHMAKIIQKDGRGRIDKFLGDGIMAIFGEHESNPSKAVCRAVAAAVDMVNDFNDLKVDFLKKAFGGGYETEYNESVELELGVGIDYGTVLFEYLGDDQYREYTAVGDHVNFAQRLEAQAARLGDKGITPPILISATAERCIRPWLNRTEVEAVIINPKGKGRYKVYGINPNGFHREFYDQSEATNSWIQPWARYKEGSPEV